MGKVELAEDIKRILAAAALNTVEGAREDVELMMGELADDLAAAVIAENKGLLDLTVARIRLAGERQRIKINAVAIGVLQDVARAIFNIAKGVILP